MGHGQYFEHLQSPTVEHTQTGETVERVRTKRHNVVGTVVNGSYPKLDSHLPTGTRSIDPPEDTKQRSVGTQNESL